MTIPDRLLSNAWAGGPGGASGELTADPGLWGAQRTLPRAPQYMFPTVLPDPGDWRDERVGWGLVLRENEAVGEKDRATAADAPEPIRQLLAARDGVVLRYRPDSPRRFSMLRRYYLDGNPQDISVAGPEFGMSRGAIPRYLLIYGPPEEIPWDLQYQLNATVAVGRIDLEGPSLNNYVTALLSGWNKSAAEITHAVVWATDHGGEDMSRVMKRVIAREIYQRLAADPDLGSNTRFVGEKAGEATSSALLDGLSTLRPSLVVTTSHGMTGPLDDPEAMAASLGLPVDDELSPLAQDTLQETWEPDGAVWYAHACCSAGASESSIFHGLLNSESEIGRVLAGVAGVGSRVAPLPQTLLGHPKPLRAFIGHVEPTFDWTIQQPATGQPLTSAIREALYDRLYQPLPVGLAFKPFFEPIGTLAAQQVTLRQEFDRGEDVNEQLLACQLSARDRMSMVVLGDPTVALPVPAH